jgi:hypothetical protein
VTIRGTVDLWTFPDGLGRRWIDVGNIMKYNTPFTEVLGKIQNEIKIQFPKVLNTLPLSTIGYHITPKGNVSWEMTDEFSGKDKNVIIKAYMDTAYKAIKKYKNELRKSTKELAKNSHYNEYPCYDYKVIEVFVYTTHKNDDFFKVIDQLEKNSIKYRVFNKVEDMGKELRKYKDKK